MKLDDLIRNPRWLPHRLDWARGRVIFVRTDEATLRSMSFIDGREPITQEPPVEIALSDVVAAIGEPTEPLRMIFHVSFCGSTLLARLLDQPGRALALKEPQCLVDLSDWRAELARRGGDVGPCDRALDAMLALLNRRFSPDEPVVIKPSNWANNLILPIVRRGNQSRSVLVTIERRRFLIALLRGGRDRLAFNARAVDHLASGEEAAGKLVADALAHDRDPLAAMLRLGALSHDLQHRIFETAFRDSDRPLVIDLAQIEAGPREATSRAASAFGMSAPRGLDGKTTQDAKNPGRAFQRAQRVRGDAEIEEAHGSRIDAALAWLDERSGPRFARLSA